MPVRRFLGVIALAIGVAGFLPQGASAGESSSVALIDINFVFSKHERFKQRGEVLAKKIQGLQKELAEKEQQILKQRERLKDFAPGSPDYKRLEEEIAREISDHQVTKQLKQKETREEEARILYETYEEIVAEIRRLAARSGCTLVLRFDSQEIDQRNPAAVQAGVNRMVIYHGADMDMTPYVVEALNASAAASRPAAGGDAAPKATARPAATRPR